MVTQLQVRLEQTPSVYKQVGYHFSGLEVFYDNTDCPSMGVKYDVV